MTGESLPVRGFTGDTVGSFFHNEALNAYFDKGGIVLLSPSRAEGIERGRRVVRCVELVAMPQPAEPVLEPRIVRMDARDLKPGDTVYVEAQGTWEVEPDLSVAKVVAKVAFTAPWGRGGVLVEWEDGSTPYAYNVTAVAPNDGDEFWYCPVWVRLGTGAR